jgi:NTE family protein
MVFKRYSLLSLLIAISFGLVAQRPSEIHNLVFEGAGIRGIAYCGALKEMESRGLIPGIKRVAGTSAGALMAMAISVGYSADELKDIISNTNFKEFNDGKFFFIGGINRLNRYFGWYRSNKLDKWIGQLIEAKTGDPNITFSDMHRRNFKELYVTGTCLNKQKLIVFSNETYPQMRIRDAVRISMSIPLYFEAVFMDENGRIINHPREKQDFDIMLDGGFIANFPIRVFDSSRYRISAGPNLFEYNMQTIGFRIDRTDQIKNDTTKKELAEMQVPNLKGYLGAFYNIIIENLNRQLLTDNDWARTISISDGGIGPRLRKLSGEEVQSLLRNGKLSMINHLIEP